MRLFLSALIIFALANAAILLFSNYLVGNVLLLSLAAATVLMIFYGFYSWIKFDILKVRDKKYIIKRGNHYSGYRFNPILFRNRLDIIREYKFTESCRYALGEDQSDINKLFGFSLNSVHKDSCRFGWNYNPLTKKIDIYAYLYNNGIRYSEKLCSVNLGEYARFSLHYDKGVVVFKVLQVVSKNTKNLTDRSFHIKKKINFGYELYPYFGGTSTAPHDIIIERYVLN